MTYTIGCAAFPFPALLAESRLHVLSFGMKRKSRLNPNTPEQRIALNTE